MTSIKLDYVDKREIDLALNNIQSLSGAEINNFADNFATTNKAAWSRFLKGAYNHPITWWIGVIQLQMQAGLWSSRHEAAAQVRASTLWQVSRPIREELAGLAEGKPSPILAAIVKYNVINRKADIAGRLSGGVFTNYASTGGRFGNRRISPTAKRLRATTNLVIASYGAAIKAIAKGMKTPSAIAQAIMTGEPENVPTLSPVADDLSHIELEALRDFAAVTDDALSLAQASASPVRIEEFCARSEDINIKEWCK